jgi:hypothetical protein
LAAISAQQGIVGWIRPEKAIWEAVVGSHPINLGLRFVLELAALVSMGYWGWKSGTGATRFVLAAGIPIIAGVLWAVTAVPNDPSRSGAAIFATPGLVRLIFELAYFGFAVWALNASGHARLAAIMGAAVIAHYAVSYDRIGWLLTR